MRSLKFALTQDQAKNVWIHAQKLDLAEPFGTGPQATQAAIEHLGYVQIDTIHVVERCHHHILFNRIPQYLRQDLHAAQSLEKTVFEYWTHALSYVPTRDYSYFVGQMKEMKKKPTSWFKTVKPEELKKVLRLIKKNGAISIRDIGDDVPVEKDHPWGSTKPSKRALQLAFHTGQLVVSERVGMLKKYDLAQRHFPVCPTKAPPQSAVNEYLLQRALRSQGLVSLDSICYLDAKKKPALTQLIEKKVKTQELVPVHIEGSVKTEYWARPESLDTLPSESTQTHILSPFDPLIIQRKRLKQFFDYDHRFEAYLPQEKRVYGYFALPVLHGNKIIAALDLKADRQAKQLRIQKWNWIEGNKSPAHTAAIEGELHRFERFQLSSN